MFVTFDFIITIMRITLTHNLFLFWLFAIVFSSTSLIAKTKKSKHNGYSKVGSSKHKGKHSLIAHKKTGHFLPVDPEAFATENNTVIDPDTLGHIYYSKIFDMPVDSGANIKLFHTVENWIGTPYRLGGSNHWGIDCSQFASKLYTSVSNSFVGQTCREIIGKVKRLTMVQLKPGDFVFFKIHGPSASHMGVYLGGNKFVHSSSSKGVMISSLNDPYFQKHFLSGGRPDSNEDPAASQEPATGNILNN